jgi:hypothetical protein
VLRLITAGLKSDRRQWFASLVLSALAGIVWGLLGHSLVYDTNLRGGASLAFGTSPPIGLLIGLVVIHTNPATMTKRLLLSLLNLYVAVALFGSVVWLSFSRAQPPAASKRAQRSPRDRRLGLNGAASPARGAVSRRSRD